MVEASTVFPLILGPAVHVGKNYDQVLDEGAFTRMMVIHLCSPLLVRERKIISSVHTSCPDLILWVLESLRDVSWLVFFHSE